MNTQHMPSIELVQGAPPGEPQVGVARWRRWKVFLVTLIVGIAIGLALVYVREPVYRATASILTVEPKGVDSRSAEADVEHVAIQGRLLLGEELLGRLSRQLETSGDAAMAGIDQLRNRLSVMPIPDTNLLELRAEGENPEQLQRVINRWAESYEGFRAEEIATATGRTTEEIEEQQRLLSSRIESARDALLAFRQRNEIVGLERGENRAMAALKGLNDSVNKARDKLVEARARKTAIDDAIARGETVIPSEQKRQISELQLTVERSRAYLEELRQKYTQAYIERDPALKSLPAILRSQERDLAAALALARRTVADEAAQEIEAARVSLETLESRLTAQQDSVQTFNQRFKEFKVLEEELARLESLQADNAERLAQIQIKNFRDYPPIQIVEWARVPDRPIHPDYDRDLMIALGAALVVALFVTWLFDYLSERSAHRPNTPPLGVRIYAGGQAQPMVAQSGAAQLQRDVPAAVPLPPLEAPPANLPALPRELNGMEIQALLATCDRTIYGYAALLLSGISPYELPLLHARCFDHHSHSIEIPGAGARQLVIDASVWSRLDAAIDDLDESAKRLSVADINKRLAAAAHQASIIDPAGINALGLWHSYALYLIRQGIDPATLHSRLGSVPAETLSILQSYHPPSGPRPAGSIQFTYPALAG